MPFIKRARARIEEPAPGLTCDRLLTKDDTKDGRILIDRWQVIGILAAMGAVVLIAF